MTDNTNIEACPFCGGADIEDITTPYTQWGLCRGCGAKAPNWNHRAALSNAEPVASVSGYYGGRCVIVPIDPAVVLPVNLALYLCPTAATPRGARYLPGKDN